MLLLASGSEPDAATSTVMLCVILNKRKRTTQAAKFSTTCFGQRCNALEDVVLIVVTPGELISHMKREGQCSFQKACSKGPCSPETRRRLLQC